MEETRGSVPSAEAKERTNRCWDRLLTLTSCRFQAQELFSLVRLSTTAILTEPSLNFARPAPSSPSSSSYLTFVHSFIVYKECPYTNSSFKFNNRTLKWKHWCYIKNDSKTLHIQCPIINLFNDPTRHRLFDDFCLMLDDRGEIICPTLCPRVEVKSFSQPPCCSALLPSEQSGLEKWCDLAKDTQPGSGKAWTQVVTTVFLLLSHQSVVNRKF